jgi:glycosyltransferase involved in cell wall biosynthesis
MKNTSLSEIAVLFTVYKPGDEIKQTLDSLRTQSEAFKLFVVDDGTPYPVDYEKLTQGIDVHITRLPRNVGRTAALNVGLREIIKANLQYVALIDNADTCSPERFTKQVNFLKRHPDISIVSTRVRYVFQISGRVMEAKLPDTWQACARLLRYNAPITHTAMMARLDVFKTVGLYSEDYPAAEDYALEHMAHAHGLKMINIPEILMETLEMHESISGGNRLKQMQSRLQLQRRYFDWLDIHSYLGICRTLILLYAPTRLLRKIKSTLRP